MSKSSDLTESSDHIESSDQTESGDKACTQSQPVEPLYIAAGDEEEHLKNAIFEELGDLSPDDIEDTLNFLEELLFFDEEEEDEGVEDCFS